MIALSEEQKKYIKNNSIPHQPNSIVIDGVKYYFKRAYYPDSFNELIAEKVAKKIGLHSVHYELVKIDGEWYYLSEDLNRLGNFHLGEEIFKSYDPDDNGVPRDIHSLYEMWNSLQYKYGHNGILVFDLVKTYLMDIFCIQPDRIEKNWGVLEADGNETLYILDNENMFITNAVELTSGFNLRDVYHYHGTIDYNDVKYSGIRENVKDLEFFLESSSEEYTQVFNQIYEMLTPEFIADAMREVEEENRVTIPNKKRKLELYQMNYELIGKLREARGLNGKKLS